jgi:hypothetical protein
MTTTVVDLFRGGVHVTLLTFASESSRRFGSQEMSLSRAYRHPSCE